MEHDAVDCSKTYEGSSKGMEAAGAETIMKNVFEHTEVDAYLATVVMDDDSSTKAKLCHPFDLALELGIIDKWPTYINKRGVEAKKKSHGILTAEHPPIVFFADKNHRVRSYGSCLWRLARAAKKTSHMSKTDARRLQQNLSYMLHMYCDKEFEEFQKDLGSQEYRVNEVRQES